MSPSALEGKRICSGLRYIQCPVSSNLDCVCGFCEVFKSYLERGVLEESRSSHSWPLDGGVAEGMTAQFSPSLPPSPQLSSWISEEGGDRHLGSGSSLALWLGRGGLTLQPLSLSDLELLVSKTLQVLHLELAEERETAFVIVCICGFFCN